VGAAHPQAGLQGCSQGRGGEIAQRVPSVERSIKGAFAALRTRRICRIGQLLFQHAIKGWLISLVLRAGGAGEEEVWAVTTWLRSPGVGGHGTAAVTPLVGATTPAVLHAACLTHPHRPAVSAHAARLTMLRASVFWLGLYSSR
jgi:hypothetical protein